MRFTIPLLYGLTCCSGPHAPGPVPLKRILVIGDSISIGYTPFLQAGLKGEYSVERISGLNPGLVENAQWTDHTLARLDLYMRNAPYDLVVWNNGLWDMGVPDKDTPNVVYNPVAQYQYKIGKIASDLMLDYKVPRILFLTTTPVNPGNIQQTAPDTVAEYNDAAEAELIWYNAVKFADLNAFIAPHSYLHLPDGVHWTQEGYRLMAEFIIEAIKKEFE